MHTPVSEQRSLHSMRKHIDLMLAKGWSITGRDPLRLESAGRTCVIRHGMLISELKAA
jgi:hypothetical protein